MIVVILVGVPMWWKTTEVYRVKLPSNDILSLNAKSVKISQKVGIFTFQQERGELLVNELKAAFKDDENWNLEFVQIAPFDKAKTAKTPAGLETLILKDFALSVGDFIFIEWPKLQENILLTTERSALMRSDTSYSEINHVLRRVILQTPRMNDILNTEKRSGSENEAPQAEYDVIVSVLNPRPDVMDAKWHLPMAVETYIMPLLKEVSQLSNFTVKTQWKYQLPFESELKQVRDSSKLGRHYALSEESFPHIITSIEKNLGVGITDKSPINLVVYIAPCDIAPVHIYDRYGRQATKHNVDSFISPKWGGVIIANPPMDACLSYMTTQQRVQFYVQTNDVMQIMMYQLYKLLDIKVEIDIEGVKAVELEQIAPRRWEYDSYIRRGTMTHITTAINTLQSLINLLDNISYIVINDDVGTAINEAYINILNALEAVQQNELLSASDYAKKAFVISEQAFFDASLLAQLYFPDEQKYAIYIPLFLPIMVPVLSSFSMIRKLWMKVKNADKLKTE